MSTELILILVLCLFFLLLAIEVPVAFALGGSGIAGVVLLHSFDVAESVLSNVPYESTATFALVVIPLYILLGAMASQAKIPERIYSLINRVAGDFQGGIAVATIGACGGFAAVSGSSVATAATLGRISVRQMMRHGYRPELATGIVASGATLGILIPPSIILIMYSVMSGESIAALFSAGIIPGILSALVYMVMAVYLVRRETAKGLVKVTVKERELAGVRAGTEVQGPDNPAEAQVTGSSTEEGTSNGGERSSLLAEARSLIWLAAIVLTVMLGIFTGTTTLTESAGVAALVATLAVVAESFKEGRPSLLKKLREGLYESASVTSMIFAVVVGAGIFSYFLVSARVPNDLSNWLTGLDVAPMVVLLLILLLIIPLGMFLESLSVVVIVVPIVYPTIIDLGFDGVWFAILLVKLIEIGLVTPPVGMNCFVISGVTGVPLEKVFKGIVPFLFAELVIIALLLVFPDLVLWLPGVVEQMQQ
jgi:C4-dicarboxylate transporter DctM subunit